MVSRLYPHKGVALRKLTDAQKREKNEAKFGPAIRIHKQGFTCKEIARMLGLSEAYVGELIRQARWRRMMNLD